MSTDPWGTYKASRFLEKCIALHRNGIQNRRLKKHFRKILVTAYNIHDVTWNDLKLRCYVKNNATERDIVFGGACDNQQELSLVLAQLQPGNIFLDVGANCGLFALAAAKKVGERGRVVAIEPNPAMTERLRFNVLANGFQNIDVKECAAGDMPGTAELCVYVKEMGRSSLVETSVGPRIAVSVMPLTDILQELGIDRIDVMKIDVEGFEDRALLPLLQDGARRFWPRAILMEIRNMRMWRDDCLDRLGAAGYKSEWQSDNDVLMVLN